MKKFFKGLLKFITTPFVSIGINPSTEKLIKFLNKHKYIFYIITTILTALIIFLIYFLPYI